jgi:pimeloyl-ACP methyl ester carboxylesterase
MGHDGAMEVRRPDGSVIAVEVAGEPGAVPVLICHGLADSRLTAELFTEVARELGLLIIVPDRPGTGRTDRRRLGRVADWAQDAALVLDRLAPGPAAVAGISAGGPFAAACAAELPGRVTSLTLVAPLGRPEWPTAGMATGERVSLEVSRPRGFTSTLATATSRSSTLPGRSSRRWPGPADTGIATQHRHPLATSQRPG